MIDLCEQVVESEVLATWEVVHAVTAWRQAAEAWNDAVADAAAQVDTVPTNTLRLSLRIDLASGSIDGTVENAEDVLPATPELPALDAEPPRGAAVLPTTLERRSVC